MSRVWARVHKQEYATVTSFLWARCAAHCLHYIIQLQSAHCGISNTARSLWFEMNFRTELEFTRQNSEIALVSSHCLVLSILSISSLLNQVSSFFEDVSQPERWCECTCLYMPECVCVLLLLLLLLLLLR